MYPSGAESHIAIAVSWLRLVTESIGVTVIGIGVCVAVFLLLRTMVARDVGDFDQVRLVLARYLALGLEFELGADILATAVTPGWNEVGKLAAIAVIRTGLNYFLMWEVRSSQHSK
jgi:uncharacterized membrane protein